MSWPDRPLSRGGLLRTALDYELLLDQIEALSADPVDWTPTLTNLTLGSGTVTAKYTNAGGYAQFFFKFTYGAGSAVGTQPTISLPFSMPSYYANAYVGDVRLLHDGVSAFRGAARYLTSTTIDVIYHPSGGTEANVTSTAPFTWDANDAIIVTSYRIGVA